MSPTALLFLTLKVAVRCPFNLNKLKLVRLLSLVSQKQIAMDIIDSGLGRSMSDARLMAYNYCGDRLLQEDDSNMQGGCK